MYLHIPKTAGMWVKSVLEPITEYSSLHNIPPAQPDRSHVYTFVRNPWSWYVSFYQFHTKGSETFNLSFSPIGNAIVRGNSFEEFIYSATNPTIKDKRKILNYVKLDVLAHKIEAAWLNDVFTSWLDSDDGLYQHFCNVYCRYATRIGTFENIRNDLLDMVTESGELTPELQDRIINSPPVNVTIDQIDYHTYYTHELYEYVNLSSTKLLKVKHYEF